MIVGPGTHRRPVALDAEVAPILEFAGHVGGGGSGLQPQGMAAEINQARALAILWVMEFRRERGERIGRVQGVRGRCSGHAVGACMRVPQTAQVRRASLP